MHMSWWGPALLFRSGGYWWDGNGWYRPGQVWDAAREEYYRRPVPASATVTAADMLRTGDAARRRVLAVADVDRKHGGGPVARSPLPVGPAPRRPVTRDAEPWSR